MLITIDIKLPHNMCGAFARCVLSVCTLFEKGKTPS